MEPVISGGGECSNAGGIQEKTGQTFVRSNLISIPALSRRLDLMAFPTQQFYNLRAEIIHKQPS